MTEVDETKLMVVSILTLVVISIGIFFVHFLRDYTVMNLLSLIGAMYVSIIIVENIEGWKR